jgi:hypothetical protein
MEVSTDSQVSFTVSSLILAAFMYSHLHFVFRAILEDKSHYGLKRWEIGEIASKIGQLYYHY